MGSGACQAALLFPHCTVFPVAVFCPVKNLEDLHHSKAGMWDCKRAGNGSPSSLTVVP